MASYSGPNTSSTGLVFCFDPYSTKSYPGSGSTAYDVGGFNNGSLLNSPTYNSSGYIVYNGVNQYAQFPSSANYAFGTGDFTLEMWIYPESFSTYSHLIALPDQGTFALKANVTDGQIYFYSPAYTTFGSTSGWTLSLNTWNHVVFKRASSVGYAFLNGVARGSKSGFTNSFASQTLNLHNGWPGEFSQARIGLTKIYNVAVSDTDIAANFERTRYRYGI